MRRAGGLLAVAVVVTVVVEVFVFTVAVRWWGLPVTVLMAVATSLLGVLLSRREGLRAWRRFRQAARDGQPPGVRVADGLVGLAGALLLVLPGLVTDVLGVLLVTPPVRWLARRGVRRVAEGALPSRVAGDVFGPRRVRVRQGRPRAAGPGSVGGDGAGTGAASTGPGAVPGPVVEGEIVDDGP